MRRIVIVGAAVTIVLCGAVVWVVRDSRDYARRTADARAAARAARWADATPPAMPSVPKAAAEARQADEIVEPAPADAPERGDVPGSASRKAASAPPAQPTSPAPRTPRPRAEEPPGGQAVEPVIPEPVAREALSYVGADPLAEAAWAEAINDPAIGAEQRKDLIEDLNQDGFPDPKRLTADDLPLILSRLALIEEMAPDSMDEVNAAAFAEAYKDLVNMLVKASQQ